MGRELGLGTPRWHHRSLHLTFPHPPHLTSPASHYFTPFVWHDPTIPEPWEILGGVVTHVYPSFTPSPWRHLGWTFLFSAKLWTSFPPFSAFIYYGSMKGRICVHFLFSLLFWGDFWKEKEYKGLYLSPLSSWNSKSGFLGLGLANTK